MATSVIVPLSEYLQTTYHPDCEWVNGEVKERNVGEGSHSNVQTFFIKYFGKHEEEWQVRVSAELRTQVSATHFRVPDVVLMRSSDPFEEILTIAPLLCIEVLSPDDRMVEMEEKIADYLAMGVEAIWVVNPKGRSALVVDRNARLPVEELTVPGTPIRVAVKDVFAELNALEARRLPK